MEVWADLTEVHATVAGLKLVKNYLEACPVAVMQVVSQTDLTDSTVAVCLGAGYLALKDIKYIFIYLIRYICMTAIP